MRTVDGEVLQVNVRPGEYAALAVAASLRNRQLQALQHPRGYRRARHSRAYTYFKKGIKAYASPRGDPKMRFNLAFDRVEPYVIPKKSLTGDNTERVDTRVLQVIYRVEGEAPALYVGMQVDVFLDAE